MKKHYEWIMFCVHAVYRKTVSIAAPTLQGVEEIDHSSLLRSIRAARRKKLDPCNVIKSLYHNTYMWVSGILVQEKHCFPDLIRAAKSIKSLDLEKVYVSKLNFEEVKDVSDLLDILSLSAQWDDTGLLHDLIVPLPEEIRQQIKVLLARYDAYLDVYERVTEVVHHPIEGKVASQYQVPLEVTSSQDFNDFTKKDCRTILELLLKLAFQIPKGAVEVNGAHSGNSTTVSFLVNKAFTQSIMLKTCTDPLTLWIFLELCITKVRIPDLFEVNVSRLLSLQLTKALRSGLDGGTNFIGVTTVSNSLIFHT